MQSGMERGSSSNVVGWDDPYAPGTERRQIDGTVSTGRIAPNHGVPEVRTERRAIRRTALLERVFKDDGFRTVIVQAPAGHGKSTLLEQIRAECEQRGDVTGWLDVSESDNDVRRFYERLEAMIAAMKAQGSTAHRGAPTPPGTGELPYEWLRAQALSIGRPASIFLDDVHGVAAKQTLAFLGQLLSRVPAGIKFFIATRLPPEIGLARLSVAGDALFIRAGDLCFTQDETARYFASVAHLDLSEQEIALIQRQTDGWPAAIQLFRLALHQPTLRRDLHRFGEFQRHELASYLAENVLQQQTSGTREFLLLCSVMSRFSASLCDDVLQRNDSADQLARLEKVGLFLRRLESDPRWFSFHPLFATFLLDQLKSQWSEKVVVLRKRAADWFLKNDRVEDAIEHYLAAGDHASAAAALDDWGTRLIPAAQLTTIEQWADRISLTEIEKRPGLLVKVGWAQTFLRRHSRLAPTLDLLRKLGPTTAQNNADPRLLLAMAALLEDNLHQAEAIVSQVEITDAEPGSFRAFELGAACNVRGYAAMSAGNFPDAHHFFGRARQFCEPSGASFAWAYWVSNTAMAQIAQGELQEAVTLLRNGMKDRRMIVDESVTQASVVSSLVVALYETDELQDAESYFHEFRDVITHAALHDYLATTFIAMARIQDTMGHPGKALDLLDEAEAISYANRWPRLSIMLGWERVRRELIRGEPERAKAVAQRVERAGEVQRGSGIRFSEDVNGSALGRLRMQAYCLDPDEALRMISTTLGSARRKGRIHRQIKLLQLAALAHHRRGTTSRAQQYLDEAVKLASPGGYLRSFLEEGPPFEALLREHLGTLRGSLNVRSSSTHAAFLDRLAHRLQGHDDAGPDGTVIARASSLSLISAQTFTRREQNLLKLLAEMASTEAMADAMHLSRDGLKFHLKNVYSKLDVKTRLDAVRAARQLLK